MGKVMAYPGKGVADVVSRMLRTTMTVKTEPSLTSVLCRLPEKIRQQARDLVLGGVLSVRALKHWVDLKDAGVYNEDALLALIQRAHHESFRVDATR